VLLLWQPWEVIQIIGLRLALSLLSASVGPLPQASNNSEMDRVWDKSRSEKDISFAASPPAGPSLALLLSDDQQNGSSAAQLAQDRKLQDERRVQWSNGSFHLASSLKLERVAQKSGKPYERTIIPL
jgi:hypothetical protein